MSSIKLEVGKYYELNNGEVYECTDMFGEDPLAVDDIGYGPFVIDGVLYHQDGTFGNYTFHQSLFGVKRCVDDDPKLWRDMTPEEKGALLLAHQEGKTIEFFSYGFKSWLECTPVWQDDSSYRVKPDPKVETEELNIFYAKGFGVEEVKSESWEPTHRITFNVIDGKPDCASVKMEKL